MALKVLHPIERLPAVKGLKVMYISRKNWMDTGILVLYFVWPTSLYSGWIKLDRSFRTLQGILCRSFRSLMSWNRSIVRLNSAAIACGANVIKMDSRPASTGHFPGLQTSCFCDGRSRSTAADPCGSWKLMPGLQRSLRWCKLHNIAAIHPGVHRRHIDLYMDEIVSNGHRLSVGSSLSRCIATDSPGFIQLEYRWNR